MIIGVVIPCFRVKAHILEVINHIGPEVEKIYVVDDFCPEGTGKFLEESCSDIRIQVIYHQHNKGVGGAVLTGYAAGIKDGMEILIKVDGDNQMDPRLIPLFVKPIVDNKADYTKGNRFYYIDGLKGMPMARIFGNGILSFMTKFSSGYWNLFDPTNGFTAIHSRVLETLPFDKISKRYFFEIDLLFHLNLRRAVVKDIPMQSKYQDEVSSLIIRKVIPEFLAKSAINTARRIFYGYYLRDMSLASIQLPTGIGLAIFSFFYGVYHWCMSVNTGVPSPTGTVALATMSFILSFQLILGFLAQDIASVPKDPIHEDLLEKVS